MQLLFKSHSLLNSALHLIVEKNNAPLALSFTTIHCHICMLQKFYCIIALFWILSYAERSGNFDFFIAIDKRSGNCFGHFLCIVEQFCFRVFTRNNDYEFITTCSSEKVIGLNASLKIMCHFF